MGDDYGNAIQDNLAKEEKRTAWGRLLFSFFACLITLFIGFIIQLFV